MKYLFVNIALTFVACSILSCSRSGDNPQPTPPTVDPSDTLSPPSTGGYSYAYDSSFKSTGSFATIGALQADGKIVIANNTQIARLNQDGTLDNSFATGTAAGGEFHSLALQKDGKVLLGGSFTSYSGQSKAYYIRLNTDGSIDNSFTVPPVTYISGHPRIDIRSIVVLPDNKILMGGNFVCIVSEVNSTGIAQLIKLNENGSYDASFKHTVTADFVNCIRVLPDNKILVTGQWVVGRILATEGVPEQVFNYLVKLNGDGSIDPSFKWQTLYFNMVSPYNYLPAYGQTIAVQENGKILLGGRFEQTSSFPSEDYRSLVRLNEDGSIDESFTKRAFTSVVSSLLFTSDRLIIGTKHDSDRAYQNANVALFQVNKDGTDNANYKAKNFTGYGDTYMVLEDANKNLILIGKFYDQVPNSVTSFHGVIRLKKL